MKKEIIRKETRNEIISTAEELIRQKGFNGFSYSDIAGGLKIRNAVIHYYFPTKFDLGRAVINQEVERVRQFRERNANLPGDLGVEWRVPDPPKLERPLAGNHLHSYT